MEASSDYSLEIIKERMAFARYLAEHGIQTTKPLYSSRENLVESASDNETQYLAVCWEYIPGTGIGDSAPKELKSYYLAWGTLLGKMHRLARHYPHWRNSAVKDKNEKTPNLPGYRYGSFFYDWLQDEEVRNAWQNLKSDLDTFPVNRKQFGFIHNDAHTGNILRNEKGLVFTGF
jgi:Ser/Thr protein kinase RdoA (MazF antagonist)